MLLPGGVILGDTGGGVYAGMMLVMYAAHYGELTS